MKRIIVVDDERQMRSVIVESIPWAEVNCEVVQEANNGVEALCLMEQDMPDIALIDLEMPVMDGLELIREIRRRGWQVDIIILTCHANFDYAQEAIRLNVFDYVLKLSLTPDNILAVLRRLLIRKLEGQGAPKISEVQQSVAKAGYMLAMLVDSSSYGLAGVFDTYTALAMEWNRLTKDSEQAELFYLEQEGIVCRLTKGEVNVFAQKMMDCLRRRTHHDVCIGISDYDDQCNQIRVDQAVMRAQSGFYFGTNHIYNSEEWTTTWNDGSELISPVELLTMQDNQSIQMLVNAALPKLYGRRPDLVRMAVVEWIYALSMRAKQQGQMLTEPLSDLKQISRHIKKFQTFDELSNECIRVVNELTDQQSRNRLSDVVKMTVELVQKNLKYNESLMQIAREVGCSYCYLSSQFKMEIGMGFTEYRNRLRVEYAKKMLRETDKDLTEIAETLGYSNPFYFSTTFKKLTGLTPTAYKSDRT